jgi:hypothetical protein
MDESKDFAAGVTSAASASLVAPTDLNNQDVWSSPVVAIAGPYLTVRVAPPDAPLTAEATVTVGAGIESLGPTFGPGGSLGVRFWSRARDTGVPLGFEAKLGAAADLGYGKLTLDSIWVQPEFRGLVSHAISDSFAFGARPGLQIQRLLSRSPRDVTLLVLDIPVGAVWRFDAVSFALETAVSVASFTPSVRLGAQLEYCW